VSLTNWLDKKFYPLYQNNWDDKLFREYISSHLSSEAIILDVGAGAGIVKEMNFKGAVGKVCGVDLDPRVESNPYLDEGKVTDANSIPYNDNYFDLVFADNVMEHLDDPFTVFHEIHRVLKKDGLLLFKTPNRYHYMPFIARLTPHYVHQYVNNLRGRNATDTFPTLYRANTRKKSEIIASKTGFKVEGIHRIEGRPEYLRIFFLTYLIGLLYERLVNSSKLLAFLRVVMIVELRKK